MLARGAVADVAEQAAIYARVLDAAGDRPVLFRTLDLGADKLLPGMATEEENPAMGWRSLRIGLDRPALLRRQLRALLLAAGGRAAVGDVPDGRHGRRSSAPPARCCWPRRAACARRRKGWRSAPCWRCRR